MQSDDRVRLVEYRPYDVPLQSGKLYEKMPANVSEQVPTPKELLEFALLGKTPKPVSDNVLSENDPAYVWLG